MTRNQIEFAKLLESQRASVAQEELTRARDAVSKELGFANLGETQRANLAKEKQALATLAETSRANREREQQGRDTIAETERAHRVSEGLTTTDVLTRRQQAVEAARHNAALESETQRHNQETEGETVRAHKATEAIDIGRAAVDAAAKAADTVVKEQRLAHDKAQDATRNLLSQQQLAEQARHNAAMEIKDSTPRVNVSTGAPVIDQRSITTVQPRTPNAQENKSTRKVNVNGTEEEELFAIRGLPLGGTRTEVKITKKK